MTARTVPLLPDDLTRAFEKFWFWWVHELEASIPPALQVLGSSSVISLEVARDGLTLIRHSKNNKKDPKILAELPPIHSASNKHRDKARKVLAKTKSIVIRLAEDMVLTRELVFPAAAESNLRQSIALQLDRLIPLPKNQVLFDYEVSSRDRENGTLNVQIGILERAVYDNLMLLADDLAVKVKKIGLRVSEESTYPGNTIQFRFREDQKLRLSEDHRLLALIAVLAGLLFYGNMVTGADKHQDHVQHLTQLIKELEVEPQAIQPLKSEIDHYRQAYINLEQRSLTPSVTLVIAELTTNLPETAHLSSITYKAGDLTLKGDAEKPELITKALRQSALLTDIETKSVATSPAKTGAFTTTLRVKKGGPDD